MNEGINLGAFRIALRVFVTTLLLSDGFAPAEESTRESTSRDMLVTSVGHCGVSANSVPVIL